MVFAVRPTVFDGAGFNSVGRLPHEIRVPVFKPQRIPGQIVRRRTCAARQFVPEKSKHCRQPLPDLLFVHMYQVQVTC